MKTFTIGANDAGQRLDKFLQKAVPRLPQSLLYKSLRIKRIKVNGKRAEISLRLQPGDRVDLYLNDEFFEAERTAQGPLAFLQAPPQLDIVYEDEQILLVDKKAGLCVHEDNDGTVDTLIHRIQHYLYDKGEYRPEQELSFAPALCNRIDRNTCGIVIAAKTAEALRILNEKIKAREVRKFYLCGAVGILTPREATLTAYLRKQEDSSTVEVFDHPAPEAKSIRTRYRVLATSAENSLVEVELLTGRTHQIRAHLAHVGHPLLGDGKYGLNRINRRYGVKTQLLYSYKLRFDWQTDAGVLNHLKGREFRVKQVWFAEDFAERF